MLLPGESALAEHQEDPCEEDDHWDDDAGRSLRVASDSVPMKPRADVTLVGHAFAPERARVRSVVARLFVGELSKAVEVVADRFVDTQGALQDGPPFARMPLVYERAAGGPGTANPVGVAGLANRFGRVALPNLQPPGTAVASLDDYIAPVGFGPIAPGWPSRREKLGRGAALGAPPDLARPLPDDLDPAYFNHAPRDQQVQLLRDRERIVLENLHPDYERFVTDLPSVRPRAVVERRGRSHPVPLRCDTLWIDTDRGLCTLTWRAQVPLEHPDEEGRVVISLDSTGPSAARPSRDGELGRLQLRAPESTSDTMDRAPMPSSPERVLPFTSSTGPSSIAPPSRGGSGLPFVPPPRPSQSPPPAEPAAPPPRASLWSLPETPAPAPLTVGQLAAQPPPLPPKPVARPPVIPSAARPAVPSVPPAPPVAPPPAEPAQAAPALVAKPEGKRAVQLVWFDPECLPRVRRKAAFRPLLAAIEERPLDSELDDPSIARDPALVEDRRDVFEVLTRGEALDEAGLEDALERAVRDDGKFVPPFLLVAGELRFVFDDLAALRATVSLATPFAGGDEGLKAALADARELIATPELLSPSGLAERFTARIQEAFRKARRQVAPAYLEDQVERVLLEKRLYQKREVFGAPHLRALLAPGSALAPAEAKPPRPWPLYLPEGVARKLPMFSRFAARVIVDAHLQEDQFEPHPSALRGLAIARVVSLTIKGDRGTKAPSG